MHGLPKGMYFLPDLQPKKHDINTPRTRLFPTDLSLECTEGDQESDLIEFTFDGRIWMSCIDKVNSPGGQCFSSPIPLYHSHVLWSYVLWQSYQPDGSFELSLRGYGPHLNLDFSNMFAVRNHPEGLTGPDLVAATGTFVDAKGEEKETIEFARDAAGHYTAPKRFTRDQLAARADPDGETIRIVLRFVVARCYFTLSKFLKEPTTVSEETAGKVERILRGEKTPGCDLAITVGAHGGDSALPLTYYVHSAAFSRISDKFKNACQTGRSVDNLIVMNQKNACTIPSLAPDDMPVLISLAYGVDAPLPTNLGRIGMMGRALTNLLKRDMLEGVLFPQWERAVCTQALALDKRAVSSFAALPRLVSTVWCAPYGFLPVAKRVVIGVFADMVWLQTPADESNDKSFLNTVLLPFFNVATAAGHGTINEDMMTKIVMSVFKHIDCVAAVRKIGVSMKKKHDENVIKDVNDDVAVISPVPSSPPAMPDLDAPTVVPIEDVVVEEQIDSAKWQCTIS